MLQEDWVNWQPKYKRFKHKLRNGIESGGVVKGKIKEIKKKVKWETK